MREPVRAQLTEVKADGSAVADFGASRGAFVGMNIDIAQDEIGIATFHVTSVTDDSCTVVCPNPEHLAGPLRVGLRLWCDAKGAGLIK
ncbi:MAG: hypothetical protein K8T20_07810 [Planctomycetes bacterium]|nr:hypothetical protein [Planctomycetota bacterium]